MKITERLTVEHGVFLRQLRVLERLVFESARPEALAAVVEAIASAEEHHAEVEDQLLLPVLERILGPDSVPLRVVAEEHARLHVLVARIRDGERDEATVLSYAETLRNHLEREIHGLFPLAEELLSEESLRSLTNWNVEHIYEETGRQRKVVKTPGVQAPAPPSAGR